MNKLTPKRKLSTDVAASIPKKTKAFPSHILPYTQEELQSFIGNICAGCDDVFTTASLTQTGRPICIDIKTSKLIFCAYCTNHRTNPAYMNGQVNEFNFSKKGVPEASERHTANSTAFRMCRNFHFERRTLSEYGLDILPHLTTYRIVVVVP